MKTPMQKMHEFLCDELSKKQSWQDYPHIENAILKCEELMEWERDVIEEAYEEGYLTAVENEFRPSIVIPGSVYYDKNFTDIYNNDTRTTEGNR